VCLAAACRIGDAASASKLIAAVPVASRERLIASCRQYGVEVSAPTRPTRPTLPTKPVDCEADPMACQR
jgi:predicted phosphoribosyltransferase